MRIIVLLFSIVSLFVCALYEKNYFNSREPVKWSERTNLYVSDFVALRKPFQKDYQHRHISKDSLKLLKNYAWISSSIKVEKQSDNDISDIAVFTVFNPCESYFHNKIDTVIRDMLTHEEYHFHITELVARKTRSEIVDSLTILTDELIDAILKSSKILLDSLGDAYDSFANHGAIENKQIQYQSKIDSMLAQYSAYSDPYIKNYKLNSTKKHLTGNSLYKTQLVRKDSLLIAVRKDKNDTTNLHRYKFIPLLAIDNLTIKNGQLQRVKAFFINNVNSI